MRNGVVQGTPFLDLSDRVGGNQGLLSVAFPPDFANRGHFYVNYTERNTFKVIIARFSLTADPDPWRTQRMSSGGS